MRADALRRRNAIIATAARLFQEHGSNVSLEKIAAEAKVGIATLYRNFPDKNALVRACSEYLGDDFIAFQDSILARFRAPGSDGRALVEEYASKLLTMGLTTLIPAFAPTDLDSLSPDMRARRDVLIANGNTFMQLGRAHGEIGPNITHLEFIVGLLALTRPRKVNIEEYEPGIQDAMIAIYLAGIKAGI